MIFGWSSVGFIAKDVRTVSVCRHSPGREALNSTTARLLNPLVSCRTGCRRELYYCSEPHRWRDFGVEASGAWKQSHCQYVCDWRANTCSRSWLTLCTCTYLRGMYISKKDGHLYTEVACTMTKHTVIVIYQCRICTGISSSSSSAHISFLQVKAAQLSDRLFMPKLVGSVR